MEPLYRSEPAGGELELEQDGVVFNRHPKKGGERYWHRIRNAWKLSDNVRRLALAPRVRAVIDELHGRPSLPFQTLNFALGTQQPAHSDSFAFQPDPPGLMCGVWVALEDMDLDNGPLFYHPGSHKMPLPTWDRIHAVVGEEILPENFPDRAGFVGARRKAQRTYFAQMAEECGTEPAHATIRKGQAMIWSANLLHGGSFQKDKSRTRHSQVTHYFFEGTRAYTPMDRVGDRIPWDYPEWIREPVPVYSPALLAEAIDAHVPAGEAVLVSSAQPVESLPLEGRPLVPFAAAGQDPAASLQDMRAAHGARYVAFAKERLWSLAHEHTDFQDMLEDRHRPVLRDGAVAAIYELTN
jgi:hypothetical protein